ncbi:MAG: hypothetical protein HY363_00390 [Candidatus Aenigmarchaeota archaeon]|nr:hypothetical protein [Candidatus Aenigmarchaeota archaeon]
MTLTLIGYHPHDEEQGLRLFYVLDSVKPEVIFIEAEQPIGYRTTYGIIRPFTRLVRYPGLNVNFPRSADQSDIAYDLCNYMFEGKISALAGEGLLAEQRESILSDEEIGKLEYRIRNELSGKTRKLAVVLPFYHVLDDSRKQTVYERVKDLKPKRLVLKPRFNKRMPLKLDKPKKLRDYTHSIDAVIEKIFTSEDKYEYPRIVAGVEFCTIFSLAYSDMPQDWWIALGTFSGAVSLCYLIIADVTKSRVKK